MSINIFWLKATKWIISLKMGIFIYLFMFLPKRTSLGDGMEVKQTLTRTLHSTKRPALEIIFQVLVLFRSRINYALFFLGEEWKRKIVKCGTKRSFFMHEKAASCLSGCVLSKLKCKQRNKSRTFWIPTKKMQVESQITHERS